MQIYFKLFMARSVLVSHRFVPRKNDAEGSPWVSQLKRADAKSYLILPSPIVFILIVALVNGSCSP